MASSPVPGPLLVGVVTPHPIVRHGLSAVLAPYRERVRLVDVQAPSRELDPAVVLLDRDALAADARVLGGWVDDRCPVVVLVRPGDDPRPPPVPRAAGWTVLPVSASGTEIVSTLERAVAGAPGASGAEARTRAAARSPELSPRELDVLEQVANGLSNAEIAAQLHLGVNTVKTYIRTAYRKIGVDRRAAAVRWYLEHAVGHV